MKKGHPNRQFSEDMQSYVFVNCFFFRFTPLISEGQELKFAISDPLLHTSRFQPVFQQSASIFNSNS